jgi:uncharacterized membrane protein YedE/YeeE
MDTMWVIRGLLGGALIGASASVLLLANGRVAGISGILGGLMHASSKEERRWRLLFVMGLVLSGIVAALIGGASDTPPALGVAIVAGLLVGAGTKIGNGCTSGHGVCGISRLSPRSLMATVTFIGTGAVAVVLARALGIYS